MPVKRQLRGLIIQNLMFYLSSTKRRFPFNTLIRHSGEGVYVLRGRWLLAIQLLGRHIKQRPAGQLACHPRHRFLHLAGDAEVEDKRNAIPAHHDVPGLYVSVDDTLLVCVVERGGNGTKKRNGLPRSQRPPLFKAVVKRLPVYVVHHEERVAVVFLKSAERDNVRVRQLHRNKRLILQLAVRTLVRHQDRRQHLYGELLVVELRILRKPYAAHPALAELADNAIPIREERPLAACHRHVVANGVVGHK